jgi:tetratricopeptide (TPR) repeat protein
VDRAVALSPQDARVQQEREAARLYVEGMERHRAGDWAGAAAALRQVYAMDPAYRDVREMLYSAYLNLGLAQRAAGDLGAARRALDQALEVYPEGEEARAHYREVMVILFPTPTPTPTTQKRIEVDISEQHFYAYEGERLVYSFVCSTGAASSPTVPGHYQVLDKIPMAYASTWNLKMPYWLGIYWSGGLENGIHALPILSNGQILWDGYLGQRVSFGCIILSTEAAQLIYEWAEVGTPVIIRE